MAIDRTPSPYTDIDILVNRMYEIAMSGKCNDWYTVLDHLLAEDYTEEMINEAVGISYLKDTITDICREHYKTNV